MRTHGIRVPCAPETLLVGADMDYVYVTQPLIHLNTSQ